MDHLYLIRYTIAIKVKYKKNVKKIKFVLPIKIGFTVMD
jgi:hypothetical protein